MSPDNAIKKTAKNGLGPGPGRPKGMPNKTTRAAKEAIALAAEELGGVERMVAWAKEDKANERIFWGTVYPKLLPHQIEGSLELNNTTKEQRDAAVAAATRADR